MRQFISSANNQVQTITVPPGTQKSLRNRGRAVFSTSGFTVIIQRQDNKSRPRDGEDAQLWSKIEKSYRNIRKTLTRERYPYLYAG